MMLSQELEKITDESNISWSAYHVENSTQTCDGQNVQMISSLLPLFYEVAHTEAMICHSMKVVQRAVKHVNRNQIPVIAMDQPLFTLAKQIQWSLPSKFGEDQFVIMFGGLHIEMAVLKVIGDLLTDSGWTSALVEAGIASSGTADSLLKASHVTKTRRAHQVTAASLYALLKKAYFESGIDEESSTSLEKWCNRKKDESPQFKFWYQILHLEIDMLILIRSIRDSDFSLYKESLTRIVPWFFALDSSNYAR